MRRRTIGGMLALGAAALSLTACAGSATAELTVTFDDGGEQVTQAVSLSDLSCRTSSTLHVISSESVNDAGKEVFLATAPADGRKSYAITVWFDGHWFVSSAEFDASGSTVEFDGLEGSVSASEDGGYPRSAGAEATLDGTITCS